MSKLFCLFVCFVFLGHTHGIWVPGLGSHQSWFCSPLPQPQQCQLWDVSATYTTAHGNAKSWSFNPLSEARDGSLILMDTSWVHYCWAPVGTLKIEWFFKHLIEMNIYIDLEENLEIPIMAQWLTNLTTFYKDMCSIPGLALWVEDLMLP